METIDDTVSENENAVEEVVNLENVQVDTNDDAFMLVAALTPNLSRKGEVSIT